MELIMLHRRPLLAMILVAALASRAAADPVIVHVKSDSDCVSTKGSKFQLPPGYFLDDLTWAAKDAEFRRLQDAETRLSAENASLKDSAESVSWTRLGTIAGVVVAAFAAGYAYARK